MLNTYYRNPPPAFTPFERIAPVPGWGVNPAIVGPRLLAVGGLGADDNGIPTWYWVAGGVMAAALAAYLYKESKLKKRSR